ncbi:uncharacterized protein LOC6534112 [Drosophila yakuba]|uniref:Uncharacterized protein n=1 Tax=Drosophila yakuba TaxID=7245 RepID=B4PIF3_DROYA|nr:uncharacterized protein LOC6534112 [Drosophila yakuba]EDW94510.1 uncharacterized protein Dyak_GE20013 [Drosophila yakuba]
MSSSKYPEKPPTSDVLELLAKDERSKGLLAKDEKRTQGSMEALEAIDKRLKGLLERLKTVEESMANLSLPPLDEGNGDAFKDLENMEDELDEQEKELLDFANDEDIAAKIDVDDIKQLDKKATGKQ